MSQSSLAEHSVLPSLPYPSPYWSFGLWNVFFHVACYESFPPWLRFPFTPAAGSFILLIPTEITERSAAVITSALRVPSIYSGYLGPGGRAMWSCKLYLGCKQWPVIKVTQVLQSFVSLKAGVWVPSLPWLTGLAALYETINPAAQNARSHPLCAFPTPAANSSLLPRLWTFTRCPFPAFNQFYPRYQCSHFPERSCRW